MFLTAISHLITQADSTFIKKSVTNKGTRFPNCLWYFKDTLSTYFDLIWLGSETLLNKAIQSIDSAGLSVLFKGI